MQLIVFCTGIYTIAITCHTRKWSGSTASKLKWSLLFNAAPGWPVSEHISTICYWCLSECTVMNVCLSNNFSEESARSFITVWRIHQCRGAATRQLKSFESSLIWEYEGWSVCSRLGNNFHCWRITSHLLSVKGLKLTTFWTSSCAAELESMWRCAEVVVFTSPPRFGWCWKWNLSSKVLPSFYLLMTSIFLPRK